MQYHSYNGNMKLVDEMSGVVPIIKEINKDILRVIGTGFYITRYGLLVTANHVIKSLSKNSNLLGTCFISHPLGKYSIVLRRILSASYLENIDIGVLQAENYCEKFPHDPLMNHTVQISPTILTERDKVVTYAYPENEEMDFKVQHIKRVIKGDYYDGYFLRFIEKSENPFIPYPYYETTIRIKSGASGGPVFHNGKVIGVNCRGWDFGEDIPKNDNLSSIIPISMIFELKIKLKQLPKISWEYKQLSEYQRKREITISDLITAGHIDFVL